MEHFLLSKIMSLLPSKDNINLSDVFILKKNEITNLNGDIVGIMYIKKRKMGFGRLQNMIDDS